MNDLDSRPVPPGDGRAAYGRAELEAGVGQVAGTIQNLTGHVDKT